MSPDDLNRANLFLNHQRAKHSESCWNCDQPWPCIAVAALIDADHEWAQWFEKWKAALDLVGNASADRERLQSQLAALKQQYLCAADPAASRIRQLESELAAAQITIDQQAALLEQGRERLAAVKEGIGSSEPIASLVVAINQRRMAEDALAAANERAEKAERERDELRSHLDELYKLSYGEAPCSTPAPSACDNLLKPCERCGHYLNNHTERGCKSCPCTPARILADKALTRQNSDTSAPITSDVDANVNIGECRSAAPSGNIPTESLATEPDSSRAGHLAQEPKPLPLGHPFYQDSTPGVVGECDFTGLDGERCGCPESAHQPGKDQA